MLSVCIEDPALRGCQMSPGHVAVTRIHLSLATRFATAALLAMDPPCSQLRNWLKLQVFDVDGNGNVRT